MTSKENDNRIAEHLQVLRGVASVQDIEIKKGIIERIDLKTEMLGEVCFQRLKVEDAAGLYDFYFNGLSEQSRIFWPPYPLFSPPVQSADELSVRIKDWQKEDDWTVLKLVKEGQIIGLGLLKRFKTERPTSGLALREEYQGKGLGSIIQTVINEQARMLKLKELYATLAPENRASLEMHKKCGFKETGKMMPHYIYSDGVKKIDRQDIELVARFG